MAKGLPSAIIKKYGVTKKAWAVFRGEKQSRGSNPKTRKTTKRRKFSLARRRRGKSREMTIPLAPIMGLLPMVADGAQKVMAGNFNGAMESFKWNTLGVDTANNFHLDKAIANISPLVAGLLIHKFVGGRPLNLNRTLANAGVPFIRI